MEIETLQLLTLALIVSLACVVALGARVPVPGRAENRTGDFDERQP